MRVITPDELTSDVVRSILQGLPHGRYIVALDTEKARLRDFSGQAVLVVWTGSGLYFVSEKFPIATHPGQVRTTASGTPDVDRDGKRDVAWAIPGEPYELKPKRNRSGRFDPTTKTQRVYRDTKGAGTWVGLDKSKVYDATAIQLHAGTHKPISIGCFTVPGNQWEEVAEKIEAFADGEPIALVFAHAEALEGASC